jgi:hypothetical protein
MGTVDLPSAPHPFYPQKPDAAVSRPLPDSAELQQAVTRILAEETGNVLRYLAGKLPADVLDRLDIPGSLKEKLSRSVNRNFQEMYNRYLASDEPDVPVPYPCHTPGEIAGLLRSLGGAGQFNTGEIEKTAGGGRKTPDLETYTNALLRQKPDMDTLLQGFPQGNIAGSIVKWVFRDNVLKPKTVTDAKLTINIPDSALIDPVFRHHAAAKYLIRDLICAPIMAGIGKTAHNSGQDIEERIMGYAAESLPAGFNPSDIRDIEQIRTRGFEGAVEALCAILGSLHMGYQFFENNGNGRELIIREYDDTDTAALPDERYGIRLWYGNREQHTAARAAYDAQKQTFESRVQHLWNQIEVIYQDSKSVFKINDFEDLAKKNKSRIRELVKQQNDGNVDKNLGKALDKIAGEIALEAGNIRAQFARMHERIHNMYDFLYPVERRVMEDRLEQLEKEWRRFDMVVNPHYLHPGLLIEIEVTSIKRKKTTLDSLADALTAFLPAVYAAFYHSAVTACDLQPADVATQPATPSRRQVRKR